MEVGKKKEYTYLDYCDVHKVVVCCFAWVLSFGWSLPRVHQFEWWCTGLHGASSHLDIHRRFFFLLVSLFFIIIISLCVWMINWMRNICGSIKTRTCKHQDNLGTIVSAKRFSIRHHIAQVRFFFVFLLFSFCGLKVNWEKKKKYERIEPKRAWIQEIESNSWQRDRMGKKKRVWSSTKEWISFSSTWEKIHIYLEKKSINPTEPTQLKKIASEYKIEERNMRNHTRSK